MQPPNYQNAMTTAPPNAALSAFVGGPDIFGSLPEILVTQEFAMIELCGIEAKNRYRVAAPHSPNYTFLFAQEEGEACERICCSPCRRLTMNLHAGSDKLGQVMLTMEKTWACPMIPCPLLLHPGAWWLFCPWMAIAYKDGGPQFTVKRNGQVLGSVWDPPMPIFYCKANSIIRDAQGRALFECGPNSLCDAGMCCPCCADEVVPVVSITDRKQVATITRAMLTCTELCTKTNRFTVNFGSVTDPDQRALIFAAAMLFDLQYWEQKD